MSQPLQAVWGFLQCRLPKVSPLIGDISAVSLPSPVALGAKVIAAAGSANKIDISKRLGGADYGIDYTKPGWQSEVMKITGGHGVDVVFDPVGMIKGI